MSYDRQKPMFGAHLVKSVISLDDNYGFYKKKPTTNVINLEPVKLPMPMPSAAEVKKELKGIEEVNSYREVANPGKEPAADADPKEEVAVGGAEKPKAGRPKGSKKYTDEEKAEVRRKLNEAAKHIRNYAKTEKAEQAQRQKEQQKEFLKSKVEGSKPHKEEVKVGGGGGGGGPGEGGKEEEREEGGSSSKYESMTKAQLKEQIKKIDPKQSVSGNRATLQRKLMNLLAKA